MKKIKFTVSFLIINILTGLSVSYAQKSAEEVKKLVEGQDFIFKAEVASPARGTSQQLSGIYDLTVTKNTIISYLPFYGRAQTIPIGSSDGGIKFSSTKFEYKVVADKKGWQVTIIPNDVSDVQRLYLNIFDNGTARLDVMNLRRDYISFSGYIK